MFEEMIIRNRPLLGVFTGEICELRQVIETFEMYELQLECV